MLYRFILVKILPLYTQFPAKQLRLMNVEQEVHGATIASPMGSSTLDPEHNMDYFNRPGHGVELDSTPPRSPPVKKLKRHSMEEAPQQQTGMTLFISFQSFFWLDAILSSMFYMLVSEIISPYFTQGSTLQEQRYLSWICSSPCPKTWGIGSSWPFNANGFLCNRWKAFVLLQIQNHLLQRENWHTIVYFQDRSHVQPCATLWDVQRTWVFHNVDLSNFWQCGSCPHVGSCTN